jgi:hypothetical protein
MIMMTIVITKKQAKIPHVDRIYSIMIYTPKMMKMIIHHLQIEENKLMLLNKKKLNIVNHFKC